MSSGEPSTTQAQIGGLLLNPVLTFFRLLSSYQVTDAEKIWIITEADRSVTPLLLPDEY
jgi:hypothetical protein